MSGFDYYLSGEKRKPIRSKKEIEDEEGNRQHDEYNARFDNEYGHQSKYWDF